MTYLYSQQHRNCGNQTITGGFDRVRQTFIHQSDGLASMMKGVEKQRTGGLSRIHERKLPRL